MPLILRKVHRAKWLPGAGEGQESDDDVAAEDFEEADNEISVWEIETAPSNLNRIIAAIAGTRDYLDDLAYVLFESTLVSGLQISNADGRTRDRGANGAWHRNLVNASREEILALVAAIKTLRPDDPATRIKGKDILPLLRQSIENGWMIFEELSPHLQGKLGRG